MSQPLIRTSRQASRNRQDRGSRGDGFPRLVLAAISLVVSFFLAAGLSGCASLKEIRSFASLSSSAAGCDAITRDYVGAPERRKQYQPEKFHGELEAQRVRREAQRDALDLLQEITADYMGALAGLASGDIHAY